MADEIQVAEPRELLGRLVRQVWMEWAREQPDSKPSWLLPWEELDDGQREVDMRIGAMLFSKGRTAGIEYVETAIAGLHEPQEVRFSQGPRQGRTFKVCPRCSNAAGTAVMVPCPEMKVLADLKAWAAA